MRKYLLLLSALVLLAPGQELLRNGSFEDGIEHWIQEVLNTEGSYDINVCTTYRPGPEKSLRIYKYMRFYARLRQDADIPNNDVRFSCSAKLLASKGPASGYYAFAAVNIEYLTERGGTLGRTMIVKHVGDNPPQNSPYQHVINVTSNDWQDYEFVIADELSNLSGIDPERVAGLRVYVEAHGTGRSG